MNRIALLALLSMTASVGCFEFRDDEGEPAGCTDGTTEACTVEGECGGERTCVDGEFGACVVPEETMCDGADNDCDGAIDEGLDVGAACEDGVGECRREGTTMCTAAGERVCSATAAAPTDETCDGADNDCDGTTDEASDAVCYAVGDMTGAAGTAGVGACREGTSACVDGALAACDGAVIPAAVEACDGVDEDCDGSTDEGFDVGGACTVGVGRCEAAGSIVCADDGTATCDAEAGLPGDELCNAIDDDCDGMADEGMGLGDACTEGVGACAMVGETICNDAGGRACSVQAGAPGEETCNGIDDDCDGTTDEGFGLGDACVSGVGACEVAGVLVCDADGMPVCDGVPGEPGDEVCNDVDDDCDGTTDEELGLGDACVAGVGVCATAGVQICGLNDDVVCDVGAGPAGLEVCNDLDDDCDGMTDEGLGLGDACDEGVGACNAQGTLICADDGGTQCDAAVGEPGEEICNGIDDDCDGSTDEGFNVGAACDEGVGACNAAGTIICDPQGAAVCDAVPGQPEEVEACNGADDDCDGTTDEDLGLGDDCQVGEGACLAVGVQICDAGGAVVCGAVALEPGVETCNAIDDDCDGSTDEELGLGEACDAGVGACNTAGMRVCGVDGGTICDAVPGLPGQEQCNDVDDDCDGATDEDTGLGDACENGLGICAAAGQRICDGEGGTICDAVPGPADDVESCNGADDDCDGNTDEDLGLGDACQVGQGACVAVGVQICDAGGAVVCGAVALEPGVEICNAIDDDCDGSTDENLGLGVACDVGVGACNRAGVQQCSPQGQIVCSVQAGQPQAERCNASDDDCDGRTDEGLGLGNACQAGQGVCVRQGQIVCGNAEQAVCNATPGQGGAEQCNNVDDDCDGRTDENIVRACYNGPQGTENVGICRAGQQACQNGQFNGPCAGEVQPRAEFCSQQDTNCDGRVDNIDPVFVRHIGASDLPCNDVTVGDLNGDGRPDVACAAGVGGADFRTPYWLSRADGSLGPAGYAATVGGRPNTIAARDLDGDGDVDLAISGETVPVHIYINNGGPNFAAPFQAFAYAANGTAGTGGFDLADFNGDGRLDIWAVLGSPQDPTWRLGVSLNNGDGTFAAPMEFGNVPRGRELIVADFEGDGDLDALVAAEGNIHLFERQGAGFADARVVIAAPGFVENFLFTDLTGSGLPDLLAPSAERNTFARRLNANGFAASVDLAGSGVAVAAGNFDCDPLLEAVVGFSGSPNSGLFLNLNLRDDALGVPVDAGSDLAVGDFNGDGLDDIASAVFGGVHIYLQQP